MKAGSEIPMALARSGRTALPSSGLLCFDLDGPLLDVRERYWRLHLLGAGTENAAGLDQAERLWRLKREGADDAEICQALGVACDLERYRRLQADAIEDPAYLRFDRPWDWSATVLGALRARYRIGVITMRRNRSSLHQELEASGLRLLLDGVSSRADLPGGPRDTKADLALRLATQVGSPVIAVVGDTDVDIRTARELGVAAVGVACGMSSRERLALEAPDHLIDDISALPGLLGMG